MSEDEVRELLDEPRKVMYDDLVDEFGKENIDDDLVQAMKNRVTTLYDNREMFEADN